MANYANLLATIAANIYTNGNNEVTAAMVKTAVDTMVASLGAGYQFMGIATPATNPGTPDYKCFYLASAAGTYTDFKDSSNNPLVVYNGEVSVLKFDSAWSREVTGAASIKSLGYVDNGQNFGVDTLQSGILNFVSIGVPSGVPSSLKYGGGCVLVTMRERASSLRAFDTQFLITPDGLALRSHSGSSWNAWSVIHQIKSLGYVDNGQSINVDNLQSGIVNFVSPGTPAGLPSELAYGGGAVLITMREKVSALSSFDTQFIINASGIANRSYASGWNAWAVMTFPRTFECGAGKRYATLRAAFAAATAAKSSKVIVYPGVYDLTTEFSDVLSAQSGSGIALFNDVHAIFLPGAYVTCNVDVSNIWAYANFEPFRAVGDFTLEGLHIVAKNCRYCVHDERGGSGIYHNRYINCHMEYTNEQPDVHYVQCIGGGMGENGYIEITGGYYKSYSLYGGGGYTADELQWPISYHNGYNANADGHIVIRDVYLADKGYLRFGNYGPSTKLTPVQVSGCRMYRPVLLMNETSDPDQVQNFEIISFNNEIVNP